MNYPERAILIPQITPGVSDELAAQATALTRAVAQQGDLNIVVLIQQSGHTGPNVPLFIAGDLEETARGMLGNAAGLCAMFGVPVDSITVQNPEGAPIYVQMSKVGRDGQ